MFTLPQHPVFKSRGKITAEITVSFCARTFGNFSQCVVFDFGRAPYLQLKLHVDVGSESFLNKVETCRQSLKIDWQVWDECSMKIVKFKPLPPEFSVDEKLLRRYDLPKRTEVIFPSSLLKEGQGLSPGNYKRSMHCLLFVEEHFMRKQVGR